MEIRQADRIVTVEEGMITEQGNHNSLLQAGGRYSKLWEKQMGSMVS